MTTVGGQFVQFTQIMEVVRQQWTKIGIELVVHLILQLHGKPSFYNGRG